MAPKPNRNHRLAAALALALLGLGVAGFLVWLVGVRFSTGSVYPPYSTLRSDPLGTKALYESLDALPGIEVRRNLKAWRRIRFDAPTTFFVLGARPGDLVSIPPATGKDEEQNADGKDDAAGEQPPGRAPAALIEQWLDGGHRVVVALAPNRWPALAYPSSNASRQRKGNSGPEANEPRDTTPDPDAETKGGGKKGRGDLMGLSFRPAPWLNEGGTPTGSPPDLPAWHGSHILEFATDSGWNALATVEGRTVMAERRAGPGSLVVVSDSYFASNEGLWQDPHPAFLLHLAGAHRHLVFDETHLGTSEKPGIMTLVRKLRLHGLVVGGALLFALLLWQGLVTLVPVDPVRDLGAAPGRAVLGRDSVDGLIALLRRGLAPTKVLGHCLARWEQHPEGRVGVTPAAIESARRVAAGARAGSLAATYIAIRNLLDPRHPAANPDHGNTRPA